ncbi:MAG: hypothetical protein MZV65_45465 [Chromatiales bacterium]|nr:hypothetical protein [Chromatiales bacterium]
MQFDSQNPYEVEIHRFAPVKEVPRAHARDLRAPRLHALLDAIGRGIGGVERSLADAMENYRPSKIVFVVVTDGQENASREFRRDQILKMIRDKEANRGWQFVFLSADLDAINDALEQGFQAKAAMAFDKTGQGTLSRLRGLLRQGRPL